MEAAIVALVGAIASLVWGWISARSLRRQETKSVKSWAGEDIQVTVSGITGDTEASLPRTLIIPGEAPPPIKLTKVPEPDVAEGETVEPDVAEVETAEVEAVVRISPKDKEDVVRGVAAILKRGERRAFFIGFAQSALFFALGVGVTLLVK